jgi:hypothetical protein
MNDCANTEIQEMLPDLLHGSLAAGTRTQIETHLASCASCVEELRVLRLVKSAAVFEPTIDATRIARQIPPYRSILPTTQQPSRGRVVSWLVAAGAAVVVAVVGGVLTLNNSASPRSVAAGAVDSTSRAPAVAGPATEVAAAPSPSATASREASAASPSRTHALALAADMDGLSDGNLVQLMDDMTAFDGLPATEPEPVLAVDSGDNSGQD